MNNSEINVRGKFRERFLWFAPFLILVCAQPSVGQHNYVSARSYDNAFSIALHNTNVWRNDFYNDVIRANAGRGSFGSVSSASRVTPQEIQALCGPFPCVGPKRSIMGPQPAQASPQPPVYSSPPAPARPRQFPITATDFRSGSRILPDEMLRTAQGTAEEKELMRTLVNQSFGVLESEGRKNNVANSFAFLTSISMQIVLGRELTDAEEQQLTSGFNNSLAASPQFVSMADRDKQLLYESSIIAGGVMAFLHAAGKEHNDAKMQSDARTMAKAVLASLFGIRVE